MTRTVSLTKIRSMFTALFIAANIGFPHLFHLFPGGGVMFLPIYFFTAFAAVSYGKWSGIVTGVLSPLLGFLIFGAPKAFMIPDMILRGILLSAALAYLLQKARTAFRNTTIPQFLAIPLAVITAWLTASALEWMIGQWSDSFQDFFTGIPGLFLMTIAGWIALLFNRQIAK